MNLAPVVRHFKNWSAEYTILPLTILSVVGASLFAFFLTGRAPQDNAAWLLDYSARCIVIALAITFTSAARQAFGHWYTKEEAIDHPFLSTVQSFTSLTILLAFLYVLTH